jgi:hypothetical protein
MRLGPATQAALLSCTFCLSSLAETRNHRATALRGVLCPDAHPRLALRLKFSISILLVRKTLRRPQSPGTGTLDMRRFSPGDSLSKITGNAELLSNSCRTRHAFRFKHIAARARLTQRQIGPPLCKNCGAKKLPVEREGKARRYSIAPEKAGDTSVTRRSVQPLSSEMPG